MSERAGRVVAIALKRAHGAPLEEVERAEAGEEGLDGNVDQRAHRRITILSKEQWEEVEAEMKVQMPWTTRRANILVEGIDLAATLGKSLQLGDVRVRINGETEPCGQMESAQPGLLDALKPACRGGVYGSVVETGPICIGDTIRVVEESNSRGE